jgi:demethylmenaquinone methyltransferase/2-methoxy-6-polyprenyl-1,4-benzoquinol methylase
VYAKLARAYDWTVSPLRGLRRDVVAVSRAGSHARVLDVATGTGEQALAFAAKCREVVGVDLSEAMLGVARAKHPPKNLSYLRADATALPFADASFDVATISFALHEMPASIRDQVLDEMVRVTRPGGTLVVVDYGLPRNRLARALAHRIVRAYEDPHYPEFVKLDLRRLLEQKSIGAFDDRSALAGLARVVSGTKR